MRINASPDKKTTNKTISHLRETNFARVFGPSGSITGVNLLDWDYLTNEDEETKTDLKKLQLKYSKIV